MKAQQKAINDIRAFNRYYTDLLGLLNNQLLESSFSLVEARVLFEIHTKQPVSARQILATIGMDKGYLSRVIRQFEKDKLITKRVSDKDARVTELLLTRKGKGEFSKLDAASNQQIARFISGLSGRKLTALVQHMQAIRDLLG
ncbi:MarR family winged helix-turn-helix transcriptional regulator [Niabella sp. 22666]|uniref:MarR family winged helix-turn-helix transcriptional regulator n=1 Tax=Niabella sp. 22666 TaxID=3453954 RepID=UPI003F86E5CD